MNAKEWDAKKAEIEEKLAIRLGEREIADTRVRALELALATLGPRPAERVVTWNDGDGNAWTWTHDGERFCRTVSRANSGGQNSSSDVTHMFVSGMPPAKVIEVAALALPEGPVGYANEYKGGWGHVKKTVDEAIEYAKTNFFETPIETAVPLYRTPQPQGVEVGDIDKHGYATYRRLLPDKEMANHRLIAIPEAK
jgi:hypothetical protein